ncbi:hypothetical protein BN2476_1520017 [Paraburkholderia piptadeniae]|uniref:Uncharacterized protein n=1 Tax=Paraburkholderia piptadeniae TaxID=1701573 RepID=A0A1N7SWU6_9BURK|nr:hypothetical protein BN2476_1520017 [Paraburkholderia piptadeniae]
MSPGHFYTPPTIEPLKRIACVQVPSTHLHHNVTYNRNSGRGCLTPKKDNVMGIEVTFEWPASEGVSK